MFGRRHNLKVLNSVISSDPVLMMDDFLRFEFPSEMLFHYKTMFKKILLLLSVKNSSVSRNHDYSSASPGMRFVSNKGSLKKTVAFSGTKKVFFLFKVALDSVHNFLTGMARDTFSRKPLILVVMTADVKSLYSTTIRFISTVSASTLTRYRFHSKPPRLTSVPWIVSQKEQIATANLKDYQGEVKKWLEGLNVI